MKSQFVQFLKLKNLENTTLSELIHNPAFSNNSIRAIMADFDKYDENYDDEKSRSDNDTDNDMPAANIPRARLLPSISTSFTSSSITPSVSVPQQLQSSQQNPKRRVRLLPTTPNPPLPLTPNLTHSPETIYIFTDGGCENNNNRQKSRAAFSVYFSLREINDSTLSSLNTTQLVTGSEQTNNIAELSGILCAINILISAYGKFFKNKNVILYSDSDYSIKCVTVWYKSWMRNNWMTAKNTPVKNKELIQEIVAAIALIPKDVLLEFKHVSAHTVKPADINSLEYFLWYGNNYVDTCIGKLLKSN
jgi:ribonuclease HI